MQVNIKRNPTTRKVDSADITGENYVEIMLTLRLRQEYLEKSICECKLKEHLLGFVPKKQKELEQLKNIIKLMQ